MKYLLANWKMYTTVGDAIDLLEKIQEGLRDRSSRLDALPMPIICPPFLSLLTLRSAMDERLVRLGAQNCHWELEGPYTGEISPSMLQGIVDYVLLGHSDRRAAGETDEQIAKKVAAAAGVGLVPILFVGEDERGDGAGDQIDERFTTGLSRVDLARERVLVVYEPTWAIGSDRPAEADHVGRVVEHLKRRLRQMGSSEPEVIYGGTVTDENVEDFVELEILDGVGATRASLDAAQFLAMIDRVAQIAPSATRGASSRDRSLRGG